MSLQPVQIVEIEQLAAPPQVIIEQSVHEVEISRLGERGPAGPPGQPGTPGEPGEDAKDVAYTHDQTNAPSIVWTVQHNLGYKPGGIIVEDMNNLEIEPRVVHMNVNVLLLTFHEPTAGTAYIS